MGLLGIALGLLLLLALAYRTWSVLLLAPAAALVGALFASEPLLAQWTQTFMGTARFLVRILSDAISISRAYSFYTTPLIGRRVRKSLRIAKPAAAAARCLSVCPLTIEPTE